MSVSAARPDSATLDGHGGTPLPPPTAAHFFVGESQAIKRVLAGKPVKSPWGLLRLLDAVLRATGQPCFVNNTFSGVLILTGKLKAHLNTVGISTPFFSI